MRIGFHLGVHGTDDGRLIRSALRSRERLAAEGIQVPPPRRYRAVLRDSLNLLGGAAASPEVQQTLIEQLIDSDKATRLVLSHDSLITVSTRVVTEEGLYYAAPRRMLAMQRLFADHEVEFHIALCNPATLIPLLIQRAGAGGQEAILGEADALALSWTRTVRRILAAGLEMPLTLWCSEDTAFTWPEVLRAVTGYQGSARLEGDDDLLPVLLTDEGYATLAASLADDPPATPADRHDRIEAALERHARHEEVDIEAAVKGWTAATVDRITERYEEECAEIAEMPGIVFIRP
jgi:hypothetical protein